LGVADRREGQRHELATLDADHRVALAREQEPDGGVAEVAAVLGVEGDGRGAPQLVADRLVRDVHADAARGEAALDLDLDAAREVDLGEADVAVVVALDVLKALELFGAELLDEPLGEHGDAMIVAHGAALDDRALDDVADLGEGDVLARELLADER